MKKSLFIVYVAVFLISLVFFQGEALSDLRPVDARPIRVGTVRKVCAYPRGYSPIQSYKDLYKIRENLSGNFYLCNDIQLKAGHTPIGEPFNMDPVTGEIYSKGFSGVFAGNNKVISGLTIHEPLKEGLGFFSQLGESARVTNLIFRDPQIVGSGFVGALAGFSEGYVNNVGVTGQGTIVGVEDESLEFSGWSIGGLIGFQRKNTIEKSYISGQWQITGRTFVGGLIAGAAGTHVIDCLVGEGVEVFGDKFAGGLVAILQDGTNHGFLRTGLVSHSSSQASVTSVRDPAGGLVGIVYPNSSVFQSQATGNVFAESSAGGLVGYLYANATVDESFSTGGVTGHTSVGGLVGINGGTIRNSYSMGAVSGERGVGGLAGNSILFSNGNIPTVNHSYTTSQINFISGDPHFYAGIFYYSPWEADLINISNSFFRRDADFNAFLAADDGNGNVGIADTLMKVMATYQSAGWDIKFSSSPDPAIWEMPLPEGSDYPKLHWELGE